MKVFILIVAIALGYMMQGSPKEAHLLAEALVQTAMARVSG